MISGQRPVPVPDKGSAAYWAAAARHELAVAQCGRCGVLTLPPDVVCTNCGSTDPEYQFVPVSGGGVIRSWTIVRQAFLPGFEVPFVLVDVELDEQRGLRTIGRLLDGPDTELAIGTRVRVAFEDLTDEISVPAFEVAQ